MIETALRDIHVAPGAPSVLFVDEAQDLNPMQLKVVRTWGARADYFVQAADDDQCIYSWTGANPEAILDPPIPDDHKIFLEQRFRVPKAIHSLANGFIRRVTRREEKQYRPRDAQKTVCRLAASHWRYPDSLIDSAMRHVERGHSVMFLASCSYMLRPLIGVPGSVARMYVPKRRYPRARAARQQAAYSFEHAFLVPSVAVRVTSAVKPS